MAEGEATATAAKAEAEKKNAELRAFYLNAKTVIRELAPLSVDHAQPTPTQRLT